MKKLVLILILLPVFQSSGVAQDVSIREIIESMTPEQKFWQLYMIPGSIDQKEHDYTDGIFGLQIQPPLTAYEDAVQTNRTQRFFLTESKHGIPIIPFEEALHGVKRPGATVFPQAIALAASWDVDLMQRVSLAAAREAKSRGIRQVLSPVINIASDVRWGRTEETFGEDPFLTSIMAEAFIQTFEQQGVITTPKHFVANVSDGGRDSWPVTLDKRTLMEVHFPPFKASFDAGARSVMTAYNSVDGVPATQNKWLLTNILKEEWGFSGFVISDAAATGGSTVLHLTEPNTPTAGANAYKAGLDVVFQSSWPQHVPYMKSITNNMVPEPVVDAAVFRVLQTKQELGLFENPYVDPDSAAYWNGHADHIALARESAAASMVLLKNENGLLPVSSQPGNVLLIGDDAIEARFGGYSGTGVAPVSMLDGLRSLFGESLTFIPGIKREVADYEVVGDSLLDLEASFFSNIDLAGEPEHVAKAGNIDNRWTFNRPAPGISNEWYSIRWEGMLRTGDDPITQLGIEGDDGWRLFVDGKLLIDNWKKASYRVLMEDVLLKPNSSHTITVEFFETTGDARIRLIRGEDRSSEQKQIIQKAVEQAKKSDLVVIAAGIEEGEFRDRAFLGLPGYQELLIEKISETGTRVVVVLVGGSAITMPWLDKVEAVIMVWYPGEQGGHALADILSGKVNPSGRLPITFPISEGQVPLVYNHRPTGRGNDYLDLTGKPLFPFGFGLSYTQFEYTDMTLNADTIGVGDELTITLTVKNTGNEAGHEVVQLYVHDELATVVRPVIELKGFKRGFLNPGEEKEVMFKLGTDALSLINRELEKVTEPGAFSIYAGASSKDIRLKDRIFVK